MKFFLLIILIIVILFQLFASNTASNTKYISYTGFVELFHSKYVDKVESIKSFNDIALSFCRLHEDDNLKKYKIKRELYIYDIKQSGWYYLFCNNISSGNIDLSDLSISKILNNKIKHFRDPLEYSWELYHEYMNEIVNIKLANLFGIKASDNFDIEKYIKDFSEKYFGSGNTICGNDLYYLQKDKKPSYDINNLLSKEKICYHPLTYDYLQKIISQYNNILNNLNYINSKNLESIDETLFLYKNAFSVSTSEESTDMTYFYNLLLNEYFFYMLWLNYYKYIVMLKGEALREPEIGENISIVLKEKNDIIDFIDKEIEASREAIGISFRLLTDIQTTFPIHVGLLAYFEDLIYFRNALAPLYTPFHQFYYKLRNVQDLDR